MPAGIGVTVKHFVLRHTGSFSFAIVAAAVVVATQLSGGDWQVVGTALGTALSLVYFIQKQRLEELRLFKELFVAFNDRYDTLEDRLAPVLEHSDALSPAERRTVVEYFNLCAEEYLFYRLGYIDPAAWTAWDKGMQAVLRDPRIRMLWENDAAPESYYGLRFDDRRPGFRRRHMRVSHASPSPAAVSVHGPRAVADAGR